MGAVLSKPKAPKPPPPPPPPTEEETIPNEVSPEVKQSRTTQRRQAQLRAGRSSTILTSAQGLPSRVDEFRKSILGV